ncbi:MAG: NAD-binding protein [Candidatus ainarchaeum sp.]|jgi:trk system potassium uptake protein TrkA|nr:NAD-binding protein [Candidatus ainarchaeum sp.]MDD3085603.1 NAD-binding protein [Candidatus ainarchaeum sp.]MDD4128439.1 NAD-binding protein [Candidatus ainarchaeum sp.]
MYIIIVGSTEFSSSFAHLLHNEDSSERIVLVVKKKDDAIRITEEVGVNVVNADATKPEVLDELELEKCDVFIAASELDKDNLISAMYAKESGAKKVFACVDSFDIEGMMKKIGIVPINADRFAANAVELMIKRPAVSELVNIGDGQFDMIEVDVALTDFEGRELGELDSVDYNAIAIYSKGKFNFSKKVKLKKTDVLLLVVPSGKEKDVEKKIINPFKRITSFVSKK